MQDSKLDILLYIFNYMVSEDKRLSYFEMNEHLLEAEFERKKVKEAISWLYTLNNTDAINYIELSNKSVRIFSEEEKLKISHKSREFLLSLYNLNVIDTVLRETIIERIMALDEDEIYVDDLKWVVLMATYNRPDKESAYVWLKHMVITNNQPYIN